MGVVDSLVVGRFLRRQFTHPIGEWQRLGQPADAIIANPAQFMAY